jgi:hypothetical protein
LKFSDGTSQTTAALKGDKGDQGEKGDKGDPGVISGYHEQIMCAKHTGVVEFGVCTGSVNNDTQFTVLVKN